MRSMLLWKRISVVATFGLVAACGGGSGGSEPNSSPSNFPNTPPQIAGAPPVTAQVDLAYQFTPSATDADGDTLTFRIENRPDWATFSPSTGRLEGTPPSTAKPVYERVLISVTDGKAFSELPAFDLIVQGVAPANTAPAISGTPSSTVAMGNAYEFVPQVVDPDGQTLDFSLTGKPAWAEFDPSSGRLWGTPDAGDVGLHVGIVISVTDGVVSASLPAFDIEVTGGAAPGPTNQPPTISGSPATSVTVAQAYSFTPSASDPDGQALTFSIVNKPSWAAFNTSTGRLSGTPAAANAGTYSGIAISVSDGAATRLAAELHADRVGRRRDEPAASDQRLACNLGDRRAGLQLHAQRLGSRWPGPHLLDRQQAFVGHLQHLDRPLERHAGCGQRGHLFGDRHLGLRRCRNAPRCRASR